MEEREPQGRYEEFISGQVLLYIAPSTASRSIVALHVSMHLQNPHTPVLVGCETDESRQTNMAQIADMNER